MRDWSINLPSWAYHEGYRLMGGMGTYDELELWKDLRLVRRWSWPERTPSISELEEFLNEIESKKVSP